MSRPEQRRNENGTVLILALIFITVIGLLAAALLGFGRTSMRQIVSVRKVNARETGTNAGLDWAIQGIKSRLAICLHGANAYQVLTVNNREVRVHCKVTNGTPAGPGGWALYVNNGTITTQAGGGTEKTIVGPVYNSGGWNLGAPLAVDGSVSVPGGCTGATGPVPDARLFPVNNNVDLCTVSLLEVRSTAPPAPPANNCSSSSSATTCTGAAAAPPVNFLTAGTTTCRVFSPGTYNDPPVLAPNNYFKPGVYFFDWAASKSWVITSSVRVGDPIPNVEKAEGTIPKCAPESGSPSYPPVSPYGAVFVFGRKARVEVRNSGRLEIFSYQVGVNVIPSVVTRDILAPFAPSWVPASAASNVPPGQYLVNIGQGSKPELVLHAGVYAPESDIRLRATQNGFAKIMATTVVANITLDASASIASDHFGVIVPTGNGSKKFRLIAISTQRPGEPQLCTAGAVTVYNDAVSTLGVDAWRVDRDPTTSDPATCTP